MKRVYSEANPVFIYQLKDLLDEKGIKSIIKNELLSGGVGELPPIETWPELWVMNNDDKQPAKFIIDSFLQSIKADSKDWLCKQCGEKVEGQFNICWSCGAKPDF